MTIYTEVFIPVVGPVIVPVIGSPWGGSYLPPDFIDDIVNQSALLSYETGRVNTDGVTLKDSVGQSTAPDGFNYRARYWDVGIVSFILAPITFPQSYYPGQTILQCKVNFRSVLGATDVKDYVLVYETNNTNIHFGIRNFADNTIFGHFRKSDGSYSVVQTPVVENTIYGFKCVFTGTDIELYVDGTLATSIPHDGSIYSPGATDVRLANQTNGLVFGLELLGEKFPAINANLDSSAGSYIFGDKGTVGTISTADIGLFLQESTDGVTGDDPCNIGFNIGTGIYDGQLIPPHADNPSQDIFGNALLYKPRLKYPLELVESPCLYFDGASYVDDLVLPALLDVFDIEITCRIDSSDDYAVIFSFGKTSSTLNAVFLERRASTQAYDLVLYPSNSARAVIYSVFEDIIGDGRLHRIRVQYNTGVVQVSLDGIVTSEDTIDHGDGFTVSSQFQIFSNIQDARHTTGIVAKAVIAANGITYTLPLSEGSGTQTFSRETDANGNPLLTGTKVTADLALMNSARQDLFHSANVNGYWKINGDPIEYPYPVANFDIHYPANKISGDPDQITKYQYPQAMELINADKTQHLDGLSPYWFNASGEKVPKNWGTLVADGVMNNNKRFYGCNSIWQYSNQLTTNQDAEVKDYSSCWDVEYLVDANGDRLVDVDGNYLTTITEN